MTSTAEANRGRQPADATSNDNHFHGPDQVSDRGEQINERAIIWALHTSVSCFLRLICADALITCGQRCYVRAVALAQGSWPMYVLNLADWTH